MLLRNVNGGPGPITYESVLINGELLTTKVSETGRHCESFIADEYDYGQARNGDRTTPPCIKV